MSLSTAASFNPVLSEALNKIGPNRFVGTQILPPRLVGTKRGDYPVFGAEQFDINASKERKAGSASARRDFAYTQQDFATKQYMLEGVLPDEDESQATDDGILDSQGSVAQMLQRDIMVGHEIRVSTVVYAASFNATNATATMSSASSAKPITDIQNAVERLNGNGFYDNLFVVMEASLYNEFLNTDDVRDIFNGAGLYTNREVLQAALGIAGIIICPTRYNAAAKGAAANRSKIWPTDKYLVGQIAGGDFSNGGFGRTLAYGPDGGIFTAETYRDENIKSDILRVFNSVDEVIINTNAGEIIDTV